MQTCAGRGLGQTSSPSLTPPIKRGFVSFLSDGGQGWSWSYLLQLIWVTQDYSWAVSGTYWKHCCRAVASPRESENCSIFGFSASERFNSVPPYTAVKRPCTTSNFNQVLSYLAQSRKSICNMLCWTTSPQMWVFSPLKFSMPSWKVEYFPHILISSPSPPGSLRTSYFAKHA